MYSDLSIPPIEGTSAYAEITRIRLSHLIQLFNPDCDYNFLGIVVQATFNEFDTDKQGLHVIKKWVSRGTKHSEALVEKLWRDQDSNKSDANLQTLCSLAKATSIDVENLFLSLEPDFEVSDYEIVHENVQSVTPHPLAQHSLQGKSEELRKNALEQTEVLFRMAILGQSTVFYAAPNTGKTLLTIALLCESIKSKRIEPEYVFYINVDDTYLGLIEKLEIAESTHFHMLTDGHEGFEINSLVKMVKEYVSLGQAENLIIILDTLKKFTDLMHKQKASEFSKVIRKFVMAGGTCISLAHCNKQRSESGKPVYAGTSDIVDDADCVYLLYEVAMESGYKYVCFENIKRRGNVESTQYYRYRIQPDISYNELFKSVEQVTEHDVKSIEHASLTNQDQLTINIIKDCLNEGINQKMDLVLTVQSRAGISRRNAIEVIDRYTGCDPEIHEWQFSVQARGAKIYQLLNKEFGEKNNEH